MHLDDINDDLALPIKQFKVVAVIPVHERLELLPFTIGRLLKKNKVEAVICVGDGVKEKAICNEAGAMWVPHQNKPLGSKWNKGYRVAKDLKPDAVLYTGSSDWICNDWLRLMQPYVEQYQIAGVPGMHLIDFQAELRACYWPGYVGERSSETIGIGRMISSALLDSIAWTPFDPKKDVSMDRAMKDKCARLGVHDFFVRDNRLKALSISTNKWSNLHKFEQHWTGELPSEKISPESLLTDFPEITELYKRLK